MPRAIVHLQRASSLPHAVPLLHVLRQQEGWELSISRRRWDPESREGLPGLYEEKVQRIGLPVLDTPEGHGADVCFYFDPVEDPWDDVGLTVRLPASLIGKGIHAARGSNADRLNLCDLLLLPGPEALRRVRDGGRVFVPSEMVGLPGLDPLLQGWIADRDLLRDQLRIAPSQRAVLFAPTWNPELSCWPLLWTRVRELAGEDIVLLLRPHPQSPPEYITACRRVAEEASHVRYAFEPELQPYLHAADLVISDVSSVSFEAALLGKPVLRVDVPNRTEYQAFDPGDLEYSLPSPGPTVRDLAELKQAMVDQLRRPEEFAPARQQLRQLLLPAGDTPAVQRILHVTTAALAGRVPAVHHPRGVGVILDAADEQATAGHVETTLASVFDSGGEPVTVTLLDPRGTLAEHRQRWNARWPGKLVEHDSAPSAPFQLLLAPGVRGSRGWVFRLINHLRRSAEVAAVAPLALHGRPVQDPMVLGLIAGDTDSSGASDLDRRQRAQQAGTMLIPPLPPSSAALALRAGHPDAGELLRRWRSHDWPSTGKGAGVKVAADVVVEFPPLDLPASGPLTVGQRSRAEQRIADLAAWVRRVLPASAAAAGVSTPAASTSHPSTAPAPTEHTELPGPLRLASHYLARGKLDRARPQVERALREFPDHPLTAELARRIGLQTDDNGGRS